jgi:hypothetical protein
LIYSPELEVKETTDTASSASFLGSSLMNLLIFYKLLKKLRLV